MAMKTLVTAVALLAVLAMPAHAQHKQRPQSEDKKAEQKKPQVDEKAYKAALERIPDPKEKYDPWGVARPTEPGKKAK
jgi:hypothetical protein